jgi:hypothetical protein
VLPRESCCLSAAAAVEAAQLLLESVLLARGPTFPMMRASRSISCLCCCSHLQGKPGSTVSRDQCGEGVR